MKVLLKTMRSVQSEIVKIKNENEGADRRFLLDILINIECVCGQMERYIYINRMEKPETVGGEVYKEGKREVGE